MSNSDLALFMRFAYALFALIPYNAEDTILREKLRQRIEELEQDQ